MRRFPAVMGVGFVLLLGACDSRECMWDSDCGAGSMCAADGQCGATSGAPGSEVQGGIYAEGIAIETAALTGAIGEARDMRGPAHRVEVYEWDLGTDVLVYGDEGDAFSFVYMDRPLVALPLGRTIYPAGRAVEGTEVNGQLCITGGGYDVPASEVEVTVTERDDGLRDYTFDVRTSGDDWAVTDLTVNPAVASN